VSLNEIGDVKTAQGDLAAALKAYQDSLAIRDRLAKSDPGNAGWQHDLSAATCVPRLTCDKDPETGLLLRFAFAV